MLKKSPFRMLFNRAMNPMERLLTIVIVAYVAFVSIRNPLFFGPQALFDILSTGAGLMILALGVLIVLISGGIDVSFAAIAVVASYTAVILARALEIDSLPFILGVSIGLGALLGSINAVIVHFYKLPTLIVTLASASVFHGIMAITLGMKTFTQTDVPQSMIDFGRWYVWTIEAEDGSRTSLSGYVVITGFVMLVTWFILYRTRIGRSVFAVGSNEESAKRIGINIFGTRLFVYSYVGMLSGLMGVMYWSRLYYVNPDILYGFVELSIIAAVVIGGAKLTGGEGTILGALLGLIVYQLFSNTLVYLGLSPAWSQLFFGSVLISMLVIIYYRQRQANKKALVFSTM
jgi:simple sugar transport system permease protein